MESADINLYLAIILCLSIGVGILILIIQSLATQLLKAKSSVYQERIKGAEKAAHEIMIQAKAQALGLVTAAEEEAREFVHKRHQEANRNMELFNAKLATLVKEIEENVRLGQLQIENTMNSAATEAKEKFKGFTNAADNRVTELMAGLSSSIESMEVRLLSNATDQLSRELEGVSREIEAYKAKRFELVEENIALLVEKTAEIVLSQKISLTERAAIVREALRQAAETKFEQKQ